MLIMQNLTEQPTEKIGRGHSAAPERCLDWGDARLVPCYLELYMLEGVDGRSYEDLCYSLQNYGLTNSHNHGNNDRNEDDVEQELRSANSAETEILKF